MFTKTTLLSATVLAMGFVPFAASAATLDSTSTVTIVTTDGSGSTPQTASVVNAPGEMAPATISGPGASVATQNADGTSEVEADTGNTPFPTMVTSSAQFQQGETNDTGMSRDYTLNYSLTGQQATFDVSAFDGDFEVVTDVPDIALRGLVPDPVTASVPSNPGNPFASTDPAVLPGFTPFSAASFEYNISVITSEGTTSIFNARADALLNNFFPFGLEFDADDNFKPTQSFDLNGNFVFSVDEIEGEIFLGSFDDGEKIEVVSTLTARAYTPGSIFGGGPIDCNECGDGFVFGVNTLSLDPVNLSSVGISLTGQPTPMPAVPLPAAGWMLIAGLGGLAAMRRRKKT